MTSTKNKILYIAGWARSGSTIISNILGEAPNCCSLGELQFFWDRGFKNNLMCGCGQEFHHCEFWGEIIAQRFDQLDQTDLDKIIDSHAKVRNPEMLLHIVPGGTRYLEKKHRYFREVLRRLYEQIRVTSGEQVIIDSSKTPAYADVLASIPNIELYVLHLVRDPRAAAYSNMKKKKYQPTSEDSNLMVRYSPLYSTVAWASYNLLTEKCIKASKKYLLLRYEDFCDNPEATIKTILNFVQCDTDHLDFISGHKATLGTHHTVSGNPVRFRSGDVEINVDDEWKKQLKWFHRLLVSLLGLPLIIRYGYKVFPRSQG